MKIPNTNEIGLFIHCGLCMDELPTNESPQSWCALEVGWTPIGLQVWCKRHDVNVIHIDFETMHHPANQTRKKNAKTKIRSTNT